MIRDAVRSYMDQMNMIPDKAHVIAAVSGGADSTALLLLLQELAADGASDRPFTLEAVHVEHGIRGDESLEDAAFVRALCEKLDIPCTCVHVDVPAEAAASGRGIEETARVLRYQALRDCAAGSRKKERPVVIALAHHLDDNAETVLFHLARGSGLRGLCGMEAVHRDEAGFCYIRPLLTVRRKQIEDYLSMLGQPYRTDSTNLTDEAARNRIRHQVLPALEGVNTGAAPHIAAAAEKLLVLQDYMEQQLTAVREDLQRQGALFFEGNKMHLSAAALQKLHPAIADPLLLELLYEAAGCRQDLGEFQIEQVRRLMGQQSGKYLRLPRQVIVRKEYDELLILKDPGALYHVCEKEFTIPVEPVTGRSLLVTAAGYEFSLEIADFDGDMGKIPQKKYTKWFDYDKIENGLMIRSRQAGDRLGHKTLKRYFTDEKIPISQRASLPLLADGSNILWVTGGRISDDYKVAENTKRILVVCCKKEENDGFYQKV